MWISLGILLLGALWAMFRTSPYVPATLVVFAIVFIACMCVRGLSYLVNSRKLKIELDKDLNHHDPLGYFFRGRVHNDSKAFLEKAYVSIYEFQGKIQGKIRDEKVQGMTLQWQGDQEKRDISAGERECIFDIAKAVGHSVCFIGYINGKPQGQVVGNGIYEFTLRLFSKNTDEPIEHEVRIEVTGETGKDAIRVLKG